MARWRHHNGWSNLDRRNKFNKILIIKIVLIALFSFFSYQYYVKNVLDVIFASMIMLPLVNKIVEGYVYWIIVAIICFLIWKAVDYFD